MLFENLSSLCVVLSEKLNEYEKKSYADPTVIEFSIELKVIRGELRVLSKDDIISKLKTIAQLLDHPFPFSFSFSIKDQNENRDLFKIYPHEILPRWILKNVLEEAR